jgi:hypothetical protein
MKGLEVSGQASPASAGLLLQPSSEYSFTASIEGPDYHSSWISILRQGQFLLSAPMEQFHHFCATVTGLPSRLWATKMQSTSSFKDICFAGWNGSELNLLRAMNLAYLWVEPVFVLSRAFSESETLLDDVILNYTGRPGPQPYIYFLSRELHDSQSITLDQLFQFRLLCRATLHSGDSAVRYFVPLALPSVQKGQLTSDAAELWRKIKRDMEHSIRKLVDSQS